MTTEPICFESLPTFDPENVPDKVIEAVNEMIAEGWNGSESKFLFDALGKRIDEKMGRPYWNVVRQNWCHVLLVFEKAGWLSTLRKPDTNEDFPAMYMFTRMVGKET